MLTYIVRRLLLMIPTLFGITALVFFVMALQPGGIGGALMAQSGGVRGAEAARIRAYYEKRYHTNDPILSQYGRWLNQISPFGLETLDDGSYGRLKFKWPSLGESITRHRPVIDLIGESLPLTLILSLVTVPIIYGLGTISGIRAAKHRGKFFDVGFGAAQLATWSLPVIWVGVMLVGFFANRKYFKWFPTAGLTDVDALHMPFLPTWTADGWQRGWLPDVLWHLVLPVICLSYGSSAFVTKLVRGSVLENLSADYARTARAKGLVENLVLYRHVFRNSLLSLITVAAAILPALISGSVVVESIFSIPGMGRLGVQAVQYQDNEVTLAVVLMAGLLVMLSALLRDILYAAADPRVTYD
jgi:ABC-type dipeptide/oligopeptide/nickel transport system permease component